MNRDSSWDNLVQDSLATGANGSNDATAANPHGMLGWRPVTATTTISNSDLANQKSHPSTTGQRNGSISSVNGPVKPPRRTSHPLQVEAVMQAEKDLTSPASPLQIPQGNLRMSQAPHMFKCPVAPEIVKVIDPAYKQIDEFRMMNYTPVTCSPEEFGLPENGYTLRPRLFGRRTELLIAITMYNESDEFLIRTLSAVFRNIRFFCEINKEYRARNNAQPSGNSPPPIGRTPDMAFARSKNTPSRPHLEDGLRGEQIWNEDGWQKIVVCIIADGRLKCHKRVLLMLQAMGVFQNDVLMHERIDPTEDPATAKPQPVTAHMFEYTCQTIVEQDLQVHGGSRSGVVPVQMLFCLKEKNMKKLNSHKWLFRAIAPVLNPYVCVLVDVGTRPKTPDAIYHLWRAFDRNPNIAGACGEIAVMMGKGCTSVKNTLHPLIASQRFEYTMSNILDKTLESCFGYISVLPGAFSAYRWEALQDTTIEEGPLISYFKGETPKPKGNVFTSNMYLAEDRILCFELVAKRNCRWVLHYVKDSIAETDCPSHVAEFISQRRRWLNGTFFCQLYAITHMGRFWSTKHGFFRKMALMVQYFYYMVNLLFGWFGMANFYLSFYLLAQQALFPPNTDPNEPRAYAFDILRLSYIAVIIAQFICSLGNRPQGSQSIYFGSMVVFAIIMLFMIVCTMILIVDSFRNLPPGINWLVKGGTSRDIVLSMASTYGVYLFTGLLFGKLIPVVSCIFQYLLLLPSYINTLTIYAFCNSHDVSWGTKGDNVASSSGHGSVKGKDGGQKGDGGFEAIEAANRLAQLQPPVLMPAEISAAYNKAPVIFRMSLRKKLVFILLSAVQVLGVRPPDELSRPDASTKREDYYKNVRTWLVLLWALSNGLLVAVVSSTRISAILTGSTSNAQNPYMAILMYAVALLGFIRLGGAILYLILRAIRRY